MAVHRALALQPFKGAAEAGVAFVCGKLLGRDRAALYAGNVHAGAHGAVDERVAAKAENPSDDARWLDRIALVAEARPGGQMAECLAERPVPSAAKRARALGGDQAIGVGEGLIDGREAKRATLGRGDGIGGSGVSGHGYLKPRL